MADVNLTPQRLREMLDYNAETGVLSWRVRPREHFKTVGAWKAWNTSYSGRPTGNPDQKRRLRTNIMGTPHMTHRLAWAVHYGEFVRQIDHINNDPSDNRLCNLRSCSGSENQHNRPKNKNNTSGFKGVSWHAKSGKWRAYIVANWKQKHLGMFDTAEDAHKAFCKAADELHGDFANYGVRLARTASA